MNNFNADIVRSTVRKVKDIAKREDEKRKADEKYIKSKEYRDKMTLDLLDSIKNEILKCASYGCQILCLCIGYAKYEYKYDKSWCLNVSPPPEYLYAKNYNMPHLSQKLNALWFECYYMGIKKEKVSHPYAEVPDTIVKSKVSCIYPYPKSTLDKVFQPKYIDFFKKITLSLLFTSIIIWLLR